MQNNRNNIIIGRPFVETTSAKETKLKCVVSNQDRSEKYEFWYSVNSEYAEYLTPELSDSFVLALLPIALLTHQDIVVEGCISSMLYFRLIESVIPISLDSLPNSGPIRIIAETTSKYKFNPTAVATGCSLGVDSLSTILSQLGDSTIPEYQLTHLAFFNSGQLGDLDLEGVENSFYEKVRDLSEVSEELKLPLIAVNSNINDIYKDYEYPLLLRYVFTTLSNVLALQKLIKSYTFATSFPVTVGKIEEEIGGILGFIVPAIQTPNTEMLVAKPMMTRVEKTAYISQFEITHKYLDVCWGNQIKNMYNDDYYLRGKTKLNCGKCQKCLRTLLTLEIFGKINEFANIFELDEYYKYRNKYIVKVLSNEGDKRYALELRRAMKDYGFKVPFKCKVMSWGVRLGIYRLLQKLFGLQTMRK